MFDIQNFVIVTFSAVFRRSYNEPFLNRINYPKENTAKPKVTGNFLTDPEHDTYLPSGKR